MLQEEEKRQVELEEKNQRTQQPPQQEQQIQRSPQQQPRQLYEVEKKKENKKDVSYIFVISTILFKIFSLF